MKRNDKMIEAIDAHMGGRKKGRKLKGKRLVSNPKYDRSGTKKGKGPGVHEDGSPRPRRARQSKRSINEARRKQLGLAKRKTRMGSK